MPIRSQRMGIEDILTGESTGPSRTYRYDK